ncbi:MAG: dihydropteroate synthase [Prevotella sp.]|nr:dihydropteroate synthase [Prevotella sp.]
MDYTLNIQGRLLNLAAPRVMGILNATPDSFYDQSRSQTEEQVMRRARQIVDEGGDIIDIGACSTRPDSTPATQAEETERLRMALGVVRRELPDAVVSVDTFRPNVARMAVEEYGADIINDVGGGEDDMLRTVAQLGVPYVLMASEPTLRDTLLFLADRVQRLRELGQKDIILDPGFGFGKTVEQNFELLSQLERLLVMELPVLVGVSRKSMIYKTLGCTPAEALNGTTALHAVSLMKGASILRVHDVKEAAECIALTERMKTIDRKI